ncbi:MAG: hypothetical protein ABEI99_10790 [Halobaculum sp.]
MSDDPTEEPGGDGTESDEPSGSETEVSASLGASAVVEYDTVDVETATVRTQRVTADGETVGVELEIDVDQVAVECVLNPAETATLVAELATLSKEMTVETDDESEPPA